MLTQTVAFRYCPFVQTVQSENTTRLLAQKTTRQYVPHVRYDVPQLLRDAGGEGWSDSDFARRAGVKRSTVSRMRRYGSTRPATFAKLAQALGQPMDRYILSEAA